MRLADATKIAVICGCDPEVDPEDCPLPEIHIEVSVLVCITNGYLLLNSSRLNL